jgi:hypothetical protein
MVASLVIIAVEIDKWFRRRRIEPGGLGITRRQ